MKDWNSLSVDRYYEQLSNNNEVGLGILDISRDIESNFIAKRTFDMTYFYVNRMLKMKLATYVGFDKSVKQLLENALQKNKKYCMIACQGLLLFRGPTLITKSLEYAKWKPDFFVVGHIMDKKSQHHYITHGAYPGLHRQYLFVNVDKWVELGKPEFDELGIFHDRKPSYRNVTFSKETINSEYTPAWVRASQGNLKWEITSDGSNWIDLACRNNIQIDNLTNDMRECKVFLYPYNKSKDLEKVWLHKNNKTIVDGLEYNQKAWIRKLAYQEEIEKDRVYAFNTETLSAEGKRTDNIDHLFCVAAGFKSLGLLKTNGFNKDTVIHYFDWCDASLLYKRHLVETWNGVDLHLWLLEHDLKYNFSSTYRGNYESYWQQELQDFGGAEAFKELWDRYVQLEHNYYRLDIVNQSDELFHIINAQKGNKVLWTTNIWSSEMLHWNEEPEQLQIKYYKFKELIPKDLTVYGHDYVAVDLNESIKGDYSHVRYR